MVLIINIATSILLSITCLILGLITLTIYNKAKDKVALYLMFMFLDISISSFIYMFVLFDVIIKEVFIVEGNLLLGLSQYIAINACVFALYFGIEMGKTMDELFSLRIKKIGIALWSVISLFFIPYLICIFFSINIFKIINHILPFFTTIFFYLIFILGIIAFGVPTIQFNRLRKKPQQKTRQIITILLAYIIWIISFNFMGVSVFFEYMLDPFYTDLSSFLRTIANILQILSVLLFFLDITHIKRKEDEINDIQNFLNLFKRPEKLTEEEVTFYRERKTCLVCKGSAKGHTYICQCDALYCFKCVNVLINLENICWVCENPLDDSKPIKKVDWKKDDINLILKGKRNQKKKKK